MTEFLSLPDHPSVFAIGDCSATPGHKLGVYAMKQAELVVANIVKEISGANPTPWTLVKYLLQCFILIFVVYL